ncbi:hypothetical protein [[Mycobacterium] nativiensis]|uniref:Uncharacterized protein n=1 Tax=[Mycobacterium] nativiensis TaxID=2855503 RepID=A0ABU5Y458_9MYCO|nr:hypothetical protein [Mycolicibacter sp. MYC340]MEB3035014.1 hypothetical protein [Mycolicibacter sp. MYC340]
MTRRVGVLFALTVMLLAGCRTEPGWHPSAPFAPSLRPAFGARVTDGKLRIWTGSPCVGTRFALAFEPSRAELVLTSGVEQTARVEYLTVGGPYPPGLGISAAFPDGFDWRSQESMRISIYGGAHSYGGWGSTTDLAEVIRGSEQHPADTYWFQDVGWLNPAEVAAQDGKTFLATCTADPAKKG